MARAHAALDVGRPWLALARQVVLGRADLVFVGQRDEPPGGRRPLGTNTFKLLRVCPAPVWVVHSSRELVRRSVLAATDLSDVGARALQHAAWVAAHWDCALHVIHALDEPFEERLAAELASHEVRRERSGRDAVEARAALEAQVRDLPCGLRPELHVESGRPADVILAAAERFDTDLVVMGTVSRSGIPGLFVGNTAERLIDRLDRSLLAVKPAGFESPVRP